MEKLAHFRFVQRGNVVVEFFVVVRFQTGGNGFFEVGVKVVLPAFAQRAHDLGHFVAVVQHQTAVFVLQAQRFFVVAVRHVGNGLAHRYAARFVQKHGL